MKAEKVLVLSSLGTLGLLFAWKSLWQGKSEKLDRLSGLGTLTGSLIVAASAYRTAKKARGAKAGLRSLTAAGGLGIAFASGRVLLTGKTITKPWWRSA